MFSFLFFLFLFFLYFFVCFAFNDQNGNASCSGSQLGFEIATIQICPKRYKNIQTVRLVEMLRLVKQCKIEQKKMFFCCNTLLAFSPLHASKS